LGELDDFGKRLMRLAVGDLFTDCGPSVCFEFAPDAGSARIDGTVADLVAVEIESRVLKQVRGALVDLIMHPYSRKLLLLLPAYIGNPATAVAQTQAILSRFLEPSAFRVVCVTPDIDESIRAIQKALLDLGVEVVTESTAPCASP
jgi:hypothetical protein